MGSLLGSQRGACLRPRHRVGPRGSLFLRPHLRGAALQPRARGLPDFPELQCCPWELPHGNTGHWSRWGEQGLSVGVREGRYAPEALGLLARLWLLAALSPHLPVIQGRREKGPSVTLQLVAACLQWPEANALLQLPHSTSCPCAPSQPPHTSEPGPQPQPLPQIS